MLYMRHDGRMQKVAMRGIRQNIKTFDENRIREIIEETKSTRKMRKEKTEGHIQLLRSGTREQETK